LPIPAERFAAPTASTAACPGRSATWWAEAMRGQDFRSEDRLDTRAFNAALWRGLGEGPEPAAATGADLRAGREQLLASGAAGGRCPSAQ
jgi:hypothetical protein